MNEIPNPIEVAPDMGFGDVVMSFFALGVAIVAGILIFNLRRL